MKYGKLVQEWLDGWNAHDVARATDHFAEDAVFVSPSVLAMGLGSGGTLRGRKAIAAQAAAAFQRYPNLRFQLDTILEDGNRVIVLYRKHNVFSPTPALTVEIFEVESDKILRSTVYWSAEEVAARF